MKNNDLGIFLSHLSVLPGLLMLFKAGSVWPVAFNKGFLESQHTWNKQERDGVIGRVIFNILVEIWYYIDKYTYFSWNATFKREKIEQ